MDEEASISTPAMISDIDYERYLFDLTSTLLLIIIMMELVAGIIIDAFSEMRQQTYLKELDKKSSCFICGNSLDEFEKKASKQGGFDGHIRKDHYLWNYVFYLAYLDYQDEMDYNGIESYIDKMNANQDYAWFPFYRALILDETDQNVEISEDIEQLVKMNLEL